METKKSAELVTSDMKELEVRYKIVSGIDAEVAEKNYFKELVLNEASNLIRRLAKKYGLEEASDYVVENGILKVKEVSTEATPDKTTDKKVA